VGEGVHNIHDKTHKDLCRENQEGLAAHDFRRADRKWNEALVKLNLRCARFAQKGVGTLRSGKSLSSAQRSKLERPVLLMILDAGAEATSQGKN
jgi:hypothetical protein